MIDLSSHPWMSGLFGDPQMAPIFSPEAELVRFLKIEAAWTRALGEVEGHPRAEQVAGAIETAPIAPGDLHAGMAKDGVPIPELVRQLKGHLGGADHDLVHRGLTSQDVLDTSLVQALVQVADLLEARLAQLDTALTTLEMRFGGNALPAFTRMQPALTTTVNDVVERWRQPIAPLLSDASGLKQRLGILQWGGPIGVRDHPKAEALAAAFACHIGLSDPGRSWHTDRTPILEVAQFLSRITILTGKLGEDVAVYALSAPVHIRFAGGGSSAMPHKNNPVKAETLVTLADASATLMANVIRSARHEGHRSGQAWALEWLALPQLCLSAGASSKIALILIDEINAFGA